MFCKSQKCKQNIYGGGPDRSENSVFPPPEHDWNVHKTFKKHEDGCSEHKIK